MIKIIITGLILAALMGVSGFAGHQYSESQHAKRVTELNKTIYDLGVVIQTETNVAAETNRQLKLANKGRIDAIKINNHASATVKQLQTNLNDAVAELATVRATSIYRVVDVGTINRVYNQSRSECRGLPDAGNTPIVPAKLSQFTGDDVAGVVRYIVGQYCEVATDYNSLYLDTEKLLAQ